MFANILLSDAILFSGAPPSMTLCVFRNMGCATILLSWLILNEWLAVPCKHI